MTEWQQREAVVTEALSWIGTKYHHQGRVKGAGVDCGMLLLEVYARAGVIAPASVESYPHDWHLHRGEERYLGHVLNHAQEIHTAPQPGDLVVWKFGRCFSHGGIVIDWPRVVHSYVRLGVCLDDVSVNLDLSQRESKVFSCWPQKEPGE